jgi:hypothetical protein
MIEFVKLYFVFSYRGLLRPLKVRYVVELRVFQRGQIVDESRQVLDIQGSANIFCQSSDDKS